MNETAITPKEELMETLRTEGSQDPTLEQQYNMKLKHYQGQIKLKLNQNYKVTHNEVAKKLMEIDHYKTMRDTRDIHIYRNGIYEPNGEVKIEENVQTVFIEDATTHFTSEVIGVIKRSTGVDRDLFDADPDLITVENGILNIDTLELKPFSPDYLTLSKITTIFNPDAKSPYFDELLNKIVCDKIESLREFCGYLLYPSPKYKKALILYGKTDTGKSTFTNAITETLGGTKNVCGIPLQNLDKRFQIQRLYNKKANMVSDLSPRAFKEISIFLQTVGGDLIEAEIKNSNNTLNFIWNGKHWFDANNIPELLGRGDQSAFYNRLLLIQFTKQFSQNEIDRNYGNYLSTPEEKSGILNWMLKGYQRLREQGGFTDTTTIKEIENHYKRSSNNVYCFTQDRCKYEENSSTLKNTSYILYIRYCHKNEFSPFGRQTFYDKLLAQIPSILSTRDQQTPGRPYIWKYLQILGNDENNEEKVLDDY